MRLRRLRARTVIISFVVVSGGIALACAAVLAFVLTRDTCNVGWDARAARVASVAGVDLEALGQEFDPVRVDGNRIVDSSGDLVILRGFVTITHDSSGNPVQYRLEDYERMREMGMNYQSIRVGAGLLGYCEGDDPDPEYLQQLDQMVTLAAEAGLYSQFKLTFYDIDGITGLRRIPFWRGIWHNNDDQQGRIIESWRLIWERYQGNPAVVGYDLLNEPERIGVGQGHRGFQRDYLMPFYREMIDELRAIDAGKLAYIQPHFGHQRSYVAIERDGVVYAPHFYPNVIQYLFRSDFSTSGYQSTMARFDRDARLHGAPLFIGEYGMPWDPADDGDPQKERAFQRLESAALNLFDVYGVGFSRPWYSDDSAGIRAFRRSLNWGMIRGEDGLDGEERRFITDAISRPYPQTAGGDLRAFAFDRDSRRFELEVIPSGNAIEIYIPRDRHYPDGFEVEIGDGLVLTHDPRSGPGVNLETNAHGVPASRFAWDESRQLLIIEPWQPGQRLTVRVLPR